MASTVPAKSQPLHNFSLPHLIWKNHRSRLAGETSSSSSPPHRSPSTPWRESPPPTSHSHNHRQSSPSNVSRRPSPLHKHSSIRDSGSESEPSRTIVSDKSTKSIDGSNRKGSNKIRIRLPKNDVVIEENDIAVPSSAAEDEESLPKTWNLRPRRPPINHKQSNGGIPKAGSSPLPENREASGVKSNDHSYLMASKKQKFSIALSRDEIEEDVFSLTGLKPSRRPKKRPRSIQKQLDTLFPGLWLGSITADSYKVSESSLKG
ncbi:hypothetical protein SSX86_027375 [Deinandra increscens subsp. villosa]|uniref:DUF1639 family protein n=1 Tax=Deinandra increscens subsp. villosa TaxID=3103831 RepID=A0AAP0CLR5_9ASTR